MSRTFAAFFSLAGVFAASVVGGLGCDAILGLKHADFYQADAGNGGSGTGGHGADGGASQGGGGHGGATSCANHVKDGNESDTDCGGSCPACGNGQQCNTSSDCQSMVCSAGICAPVCTTPPCPGDTLWAKRYGDGADQQGRSIAARANNVVVTGWFGGSVDFGAVPLDSIGNPDVFVTMLSASNGSHVWSKRFGGDASSYQYGNGVVIDGSNNVLIIGEYSDKIDLGGGPLAGSGGSDIFVAKLDPFGGHVWSAHFGDSADQYGAAVACDSGGNVIITGRNEGTVNFGGGAIANPTAGLIGGGAVYVAKFNASGGHVWSHGFGDGSDQYGVALATDPQSNVVVMATGGGSIDFGNGPLTGLGGGDVFLAKLAAQDGSVVWSKRFGDESVQYGQYVATDAEGNILVLASGTGVMNFGGDPLVAAGNQDVFIAKLNSSGEHVWSHRYGSPDGTAASASVVVDGVGNVFLTGSFAGQINFGGGMLASAGGKDIFLVKLSKGGEHIWSRRYGDGDDQETTAAALAGGLFLTGYFGGAVDFGSGTLTSAGKKDVFVSKVFP
ncbi:Secreted trypsin-like serine protease [Minicystis rosea]|nr:Secreted trypsin-like serine protease [Minicystis rosea]